MMQVKLLSVVLSLVCCWPAQAAAPFTPASDAQVLERLPAGQERAELGRLRRQAEAEPNAAAPVLALAKRYLEIGRSEADPRYYGRAEAVLAPLLAVARPLPAALTLRATLYQSRHEFAKALADLSASLAADPGQAQAWLVRAVIEEVQGEYSAAIGSCRRLFRLADELTAATCLYSALGLAGQADFAYQRLAQTLAAAPGSAEERQWAWTTLAEMAERLAKFDEAERHFQTALAIERPSPYLLASYADHLLDAGRPAAVLVLLRERTAADSLLLRLALAEQQLQADALGEHVQQLRERFAAARARGDDSHQGDEARFTLHLLGDASAALALAQANWRVQRETRDLRILLEAALAAGDKAAAEPGLAFLARNRLADAKLEQLRHSLEPLS